MKNKTDITVILDRSGSMSNIYKDMEGGFNTFIEEQKKLNVDEVSVSLVKFDSIVEEEYVEIPLDKVQPLKIVPRGSTALYDAVGKTVNSLGERLSKLNEDQRPNRVVVLIITDGEENSSQEFEANKIKEMIKHQTEVYNWSFVFLGSNINAIDTAKVIGISASNAMTYANNSKGSRGALAAFSSNLETYRSLGSRGLGTSDTMVFSKVQRGFQTDAGVAADLNKVVTK